VIVLPVGKHAMVVLEMPRGGLGFLFMFLGENLS